MLKITDIKGRFCSSVSFKHFNANACIAKEGGASCKGFNRGIFRDLDQESKKKMRKVQSKWIVYDYCRDLRRYAHGLPFECRKENLLD